jgi:hypothetical protein
MPVVNELLGRLAAGLPRGVGRVGQSSVRTDLNMGRRRWGRGFASLLEGDVRVREMHFRLPRVHTLVWARLSVGFIQHKLEIEWLECGERKGEDPHTATRPS